MAVGKLNLGLGTSLHIISEMKRPDDLRLGKLATFMSSRFGGWPSPLDNAPSCARRHSRQPGAHFSRCLREVGICGDILPILSKCAVEFYSRQRMNMGASLGLS